MKKLTATVLFTSSALIASGCATAPASQSTDSDAAPAQSQTNSFTLDENVRGELTSASLFNYNDGSRYETFQLEAESDQLIRLELVSSFEGTFSVFNRLNEQVASGSPVSFQTNDLGPWLIAVNGYDAESFGPFRFKATVLDIEARDRISEGEVVNGWLANNGDTTLQFTVAEEQLFQIDLRSDDFDALLEVNGVGISALEDDDGGEDSNSRIVEVLAPGNYQIVARSYDGDGGLFELEVVALEVSFDTNRDLTAPATVNGWMLNDEDLYQLTIEQDGWYVIEMRSEAIDSFIYLEGNNEFYAEDDDSAGGLDSRLEVELEAGVYSLSAQTYDGGTGEYTLTVNPQ